jgi:hypothetical protein
VVFANYYGGHHLLDALVLLSTATGDRESGKERQHKDRNMQMG